MMNTISMVRSSGDGILQLVGACGVWSFPAVVRFSDKTLLSHSERLQKDAILERSEIHDGSILSFPINASFLKGKYSSES